MHERGVVHRVPGMYFVGLHFLYAMSSATLIGIGRDAAYIADAIKERIGRRARSSEAGAYGTVKREQTASPGIAIAS